MITDFGGHPPNPWRGYQLCLNDPPDHHLCVLQDDALPCVDFEERLREAVAERPDDVISLFVGALRGKTYTEYLQAMIRREKWCPIWFADIHHCVAVVWPPGVSEQFLEWALSTKIPGLPELNVSDDAVFSAWAKLTHRQVWATVPSLVEHDDIYVSSIGKPTGDKGRRAIHFVDSD